MVVGKPYIHFKINNEPIEEVVDYNYTWATIVEAQKGPINTPTYISSAQQAYTIFGVDMRPYFAQSPRSLIIVRAATTPNIDGTVVNAPQEGTYTFNLKKETIIYRAIQDEIKVENRESSIENGQIKWRPVQYTFKLFYVYDKQNNSYIPVIEERDANGNVKPDSYIDSWHNNGTFVTQEEADADLAKPELPPNPDENYDPNDYKEKGDKVLKASHRFNKSKVKEYLTPVRIPIPEGEPLFEISSKYKGVCNVSVSCTPAIVGDGYRIVLKDDSTGKILLIIQNGTNIHNIVNRINDADLDVVAKSLNGGDAITQAMSSYPYAIETKPIVDYNELITSEITKDALIMTQAKKTTSTINPGTIYEETTVSYSNIGYLTKTNYQLIQNSKTGQTEDGIVVLDYQIALDTFENQSLVGGSKGEWDESKQRISQKFQAAAHAAALKSLRRIRLAGVFCMYGETAIQYEYLQHGINDTEPEKGMNNNETCKWRTILLGANETDRDDISSLMAKAKNINNQYVLFLGQGLVDTGMTGHISTLSIQEKKALGSVNDNHLLPYECTQYIAGLRSKLNYGEAIFGGQGRKRIRSVGDLEIAPLLSYQTEYIWDPNNYVRLNEAGVLTFTEDYGNITLTDGVTTIQNRTEEDEEGTMNILKYAENAIYDVCLPYIGRNIDADLENSITTAIEKVLEEMKTTDMTLIDTEEYPAYDVSVALNSRRNQLLGKIYVYVLICPVHAVRQIEVEMTVQ